MPSTVVHVAFALLLAAGLLGPAFDRRAAVVVALAAAFPDLDVFAGLVVEATHRALLHTLLIPLALALLLCYDTRVRGRGREGVGREASGAGQESSETGRTADAANASDQSWVRTRYGGDGVRVAWAAIAGYAVAGIGLDLFTAGGVNLLYPLYDQFYSFVGEISLSSTGFDQTFVDVEPADPGAGGQVRVDVGQRGSTKQVHVSSGVDPTRGTESADVERLFPVVRAGWQLTLVVAGVVVTWARLRLDPR